jgi:hypothetical protein
VEIAAPQFEIGSIVEPTPDAAIRPAGRVGRVESRGWTEFRDQPGYWRYTVRWPGGGTSSEDDKHLQTSDVIACDLKVVVSGAPIKVETNTTATVDELIEQVLLKGGIATHEGAVKWELRTEAGRQLTHLVGDGDLVDGETVLFLDPEVGGGGERGAESPAGPVGVPGYIYPDPTSGTEGGWQGTPPAEGTRRKLILDTLERTALSYVPGRSTAIHFADAIESALLELTIDEEARERRASMERLDVSAEESNSRGGRELRIVLAPNPDRRDPSSMVFVEIDNEKGTSVGGFERREVDGKTHIVIPVPFPVGPVGVKCARGGTHAWPRNPNRDGRSCLKCGTFPEEAGFSFRDDAWVTEVAYQAAGAATRPLLEDHPDYVFPAERVQDAVAYLLETFGVPRACHGCQEEQLEHGRAEAMDAPGEDRGDDAPAQGDTVPDEFSCATVACERLMDRLEEGPVPNAAELARVIDILRHGNGAAYRLSPAMAEALGGIEDRLSEIRDGVRD